MKYDDREVFEKWVKDDEAVQLFSHDMREAYKYFAWIGWQAGVANERKELADLCTAFKWSNECKYIADLIRDRGAK